MQQTRNVQQRENMQHTELIQGKINQQSKLMQQNMQWTKSKCAEMKKGLKSESIQKNETCNQRKIWNKKLCKVQKSR